MAMHNAVKALKEEWIKADATIDRCENELCEQIRAQNIEPNPVEVFRRMRVCEARMAKLKPQIKEVLEQEKKMIEEYFFHYYYLF